MGDLKLKIRQHEYESGKVYLRLTELNGKILLVASSKGSDDKIAGMINNTLLSVNPDGTISNYRSINGQHEKMGFVTEEDSDLGYRYIINK